MGIDVFGRNTYGGGGFNSYIALQAAANAGLHDLRFTLKSLAMART